MKKKLIIIIFGLGMAFLAIPKVILAISPKISPNFPSGENALIFHINQGVSSLIPAGVKISISDVTTQYQITQELWAPLSSGRGEINWNYVKMRGLIGTNASGTFHAAKDAFEPIRSFNIIYTNTSRTEDTFTLVYDLSTLPADTEPDSYRGKIRMVLTPLEAGQQQAVLFLDILVVVGQQASAGEGKQEIEISPLTGLHTILLSSEEKENKKEFLVSVKLNGRFDGRFSIVQVIPEPIQSNDGKQLDYGLVRLKTENVTKGEGIGIKPLSAQEQVIYTSMLNGEAVDSLNIIYTLGDISKETAGKYKSKIHYSLEQSGKKTPLKTLDLEIEIARIFDCTITPEDQKTVISFTDLKQGGPAKTGTVTLEVKTNLGKTYQLNQNVTADLTSEKGDIIAIPSKYFTLITEPLETKGTLRITQKEEVKKGDSVLFVSDDKGSADKFRVIYELHSPEDAKGGNYSTKLTYSLLEL